MYALIVESVLHTTKMLPVLFPTFLLVEFISHRTDTKRLAKTVGHGILGPLTAALLGLLPQCGFSVAATTLYIDGLIPAGSLISAYIATSDEALPVLLSDGGSRQWVIPLLVTKLLWGFAVGLAVNYAQRGKVVAKEGTSQPGKPGGHGASWQGMLSHATVRTAKIGATVFVFSAALHWIGTFLSPGMTRLLSSGGPWQNAVTSLVGLFPSCATSVALAESFKAGFISFPGMMSGLVTNAGLGLLVLIKDGKNARDTLSVVGVLVVSGFLAGLLTTLWITV